MRGFELIWILLRHIASYGDEIRHSLSAEDFAGNFAAAEDLVVLVIANGLVVVRVRSLIRHRRLHGRLRTRPIARIHPLSFLTMLRPRRLLLV